uniref:Uncharacterized protein n=2 Tax=Clytia hemisphaerica TaxID=252671 RepID=A0A7M5XBT3_9CNID
TPEPVGQEEEATPKTSNALHESSSSNVQASLDRFMKPKAPTDPLMSELAQIKSMLSELTLNRSSNNLSKPTYGNDSTKKDSMKEANNLLDLSLNADLKVEMKDDGGCFVQCLTCNYFLQSSKTKSASSCCSINLGNGIHYNKFKTSDLVAGTKAENCQPWYSFKNYILAHFNFPGDKGEGVLHFKAKQFEIKDRRKKSLQMEVTKNVVSTALTVCKVKSAGLSFETLLSLVSTCGGDIGNIGHGR